MKKSILCFALLLAFGFGCKKGTEPQTTEGQSTVATPNDDQTQVEERAPCSCNVTISSTYFAGLIICGVAGAGGTCGITPPGSCVSTCGNQQVITPPNRNGSFTFNDNCSICFTNPSLSTAIQIQLDCMPNLTIDLDPGETECYAGTCNGNFSKCQ